MKNRANFKPSKATKIVKGSKVLINANILLENNLYKNVDKNFHKLMTCYFI